MACFTCFGQKYITYEAGMGTRDMNDPDTWVLYQRVRAVHDGMVFYADSALLNQVRNDLTAFGHIKIIVSDTTTIFGDQLYYDGESRVLDIWDDTVRLVDGATVLKTDHLVYDRVAAVASYDSWGIITNKDKRLTSRVGFYNSDFKTFDIYDSVVLTDSNNRVVTDTLLYGIKTHRADFWSPTWVFTDSATLYSERGFYNTELRLSHSYKSSQVHHEKKSIVSDSLIFYEETEFGQAMGNVVIYDSVNEIICTSRYAETKQETRTSFVTDSALVRMIHRSEDDSTAVPDTLYLHADSIYVVNDSARNLSSVMAYRHAKVFRNDAQAMSDSIYYSAQDSTLHLFYSPVIWYGDYQATADTIIVSHDSSGAKQAFFKSNCFFIEKLDPEKFNQVKGRNTIVFFDKGEPTYSDILGNAEMVYHIVEEDDAGRQFLIGVNVGKGSDMKIYFVDRAPDRVVTIGAPDMDTYPIEQLEKEKRYLPQFKWYDSQRPRRPMDVFQW